LQQFRKRALRLLRRAVLERDAGERPVMVEHIFGNGIVPLHRIINPAALQRDQIGREAVITHHAHRPEPGRRARLFLRRANKQTHDENIVRAERGIDALIHLQGIGCPDPLAVLLQPYRVERFDAHHTKPHPRAGRECREPLVAMHRVTAQEAAERETQLRPGHRLQQRDGMTLVATEIIVREDELAHPNGVQRPQFLHDAIDRLVALLEVPERVNVAKIASMRAAPGDLDRGTPPSAQAHAVGPQVENLPFRQRHRVQVDRYGGRSRAARLATLGPMQARDVVMLDRVAQ